MSFLKPVEPYLTEERELLLVWLRLSFSLDILDADLERLLDFFDRERLRDFFDGDPLLDFFGDRERLRDCRFDDDLCLLSERNLAVGERDADFLAIVVHEGDRDSVERFDSEEDLDRDVHFVLVLGDFFIWEADLDDRLGDAGDFLSRERDRDFLSCDGDGDLEDLLPNDGDLVHDLDADLEYDLFPLSADLERWSGDFKKTRSNKGGGDSLGERSFIIASSRDEVAGANAAIGIQDVAGGEWEAGGEREADDSPLFFVDGWSFLGEFFLPQAIGGDLDDRRFVLVVTGDTDLTLSNDCWDNDVGNDDVGNGSAGGDSLGDLILIAASSRVSGRAGEGDLLESGDCTTIVGRDATTGNWRSLDSDRSRIAELAATMFTFVSAVIDALLFGGSFGRAMSNTLPPPLSSFLSTLIFTGLMTDFFSRVSRALAARPLCKRFSVFSSIIRSSSSCCCCCCLGSSSARSASSSLDDLRLTLGATICARLFFDVERDFARPFLLFFALRSRRFCSSKISL